MKPAPTWSAKARTGYTTIEVDFKVVTPVFGGGVRIDPAAPHHKEIDPITPIRAASIRGHLRFWWREWYQANHTKVTAQALRELEGAIWGLASSPGQVRIAVTKQPAVGAYQETYELQPKPNGGWRVRARDAAIAYGAFPLQTSDLHLGSEDPNIRAPGHLWKLNGPARLRLSFPGDLKAGVGAALDLWLSFGGIGGRTRRGFGAVHAANRPRYSGDGFPWFKIAQGTTPQRALEAGLQRYKSFRQARGRGREGRPGRSKWPEPDTIRRLAEQHHHQHAPECPVQKFPRAAFGLPIIFHFKDGGDPQPQITLQPKGLERMASPLLLRPIQVNGQWLCAGLRLNGRVVPPLEAKGRNWQPTSALSPQEARQLGLPGNAPDVIEAFKNFCNL